MNPSILLFVSFLCGQVTPDHEALLKGLMSGDRSVRKATVQRVEQLSEKELVALAQSAVDKGILKDHHDILVFHRILTIAQKKGLRFDETMALLKSPGSSKSFRMAILNWLFEAGIKDVSPEDAVACIEEFDQLFMDQQESVEIRLAAHKIARELATTVQAELRNARKAGTNEDWQTTAAKSLETHISRVCAIVVVATESDSVVESFAGYVPYYRIYIKDGVVKDRTLKSCVESALRDKDRGDKCRKNLQEILSRL